MGEESCVISFTQFAKTFTPLKQHLYVQIIYAETSAITLAITSAPMKYT